MPVTDVRIGNNVESIVHSLEVQFTGDQPVQLKFISENKDQVLKLSDEDALKHVKQRLGAENPVFAAYMAARFISEEDYVIKNNAHTPLLQAASETTFNRTLDYAATLSWFNNVDADEARAMRDSGQKDELPELKAVREALSKAMLDRYERPRMLGNPPELVIYEKGTDRAYKVGQLSDGYRAMLALVMDLARRIAQARGDDRLTEGSLLNFPAIVLIDEIELHLHPSWQQTVLTTLMGIFTNTQFIVTTHSPQVLTSIPAKHIRILSDGKAHPVDEQTQGAEASRLLKHVFGVDLRPKYLDIVQDLNDYEKLVYDEQWGTPEAVELRKKLDAHYRRDEPRLMELDLHIENTKWERGL
jgi:hypothetical protein